MFENLGVLNFWTYLAGLVLIIIVPGPNSLYVLKSSTSRGTNAGYRAAIGVFTGDAILIFLSFIHWCCLGDQSLSNAVYHRKILRGSLSFVLRVQNLICNFLAEKIVISRG